MNLPDFDVFLNQFDESAIRAIPLKHFANDLPEVSSFDKFDEYMEQYNFCSSASYSDTLVALLRAYHEWLQQQLNLTSQ